MGAIEWVGFGEGLCPSPTGGLIFLNLALNISQILHIFTFLPCVEKEFFTVVNRQDNNKNSSQWTNFCEDPHCQFTVCYSISHNVYKEHRCLTCNIIHCQTVISTSYEHWRFQSFSQGRLSPHKTRT